MFLQCWEREGSRGARVYWWIADVTRILSFHTIFSNYCTHCFCNCIPVLMRTLVRFLMVADKHPCWWLELVTLWWHGFISNVRSVTLMIFVTISDFNQNNIWECELGTLSWVRARRGTRRVWRGQPWDTILPGMRRWDLLTKYNNTLSPHSQIFNCSTAIWYTLLTHTFPSPFLGLGAGEVLRRCSVIKQRQVKLNSK